MEKSLKEMLKVGTIAGVGVIVPWSALLVAAILSQPANKLEKEISKEISKTKLIHEYLDLDENRTYETHRAVFETGSKREVVYGFQNIGEWSRDNIENLPLIGDERRFIPKY